MASDLQIPPELHDKFDYMDCRLPKISPAMPIPDHIQRAIQERAARRAGRFQEETLGNSDV
ncbi:hypothetical protein [Azospirillum sp.]|uniref:hypothetical protein n=1 Tax=Azospirillum sp. TaxID=34012 RepID=UPI002D58FF3C|nr:hypothetical protein [Azospirillum sp.]HYD68508.1 hypothetical protein [Azospirillum sp.]